MCTHWWKANRFIFNIECAKEMNKQNDLPFQSGEHNKPMIFNSIEIIPFVSTYRNSSDSAHTKCLELYLIEDCILLYLEFRNGKKVHHFWPLFDYKESMDSHLRSISNFQLLFEYSKNEIRLSRIKKIAHPIRFLLWYFSLSFG